MRVTERLIRYGDCLVIPGSVFDENTGRPIRDTLLRCEAELFLRPQMLQQRYRTTITSGGKRGLRKFGILDPSKTEASQMVEWAVEQGSERSSFLIEPYALETLGNLLFVTCLLLQNELHRPVFVSQQHHLLRLKLAASPWFSQSGIKPYYYVVPDMLPGTSLAALAADIESTFVSSDRGYNFIQQFVGSVPPLTHTGWTKNKFCLEIAVRWLFGNARGYKKDGSRGRGRLRYEDAYDLEQVLADLGIKKKGCRDRRTPKSPKETAL